jgi:hypothetical protein
MPQTGGVCDAVRRPVLGFLFAFSIEQGEKTNTMRHTRWKAATIAAAAALVALMGGPAHASPTGAAVADGPGYDYDPSCLASTSIAPPAANSYGTRGCDGVSTFDGSAKALDGVNTLQMRCHPWQYWDAAKLLCINYIDPWIYTEVNFAQPNIPAAGSRAVPDGTAATLDLPSKNFVGATYYSLFQNKTVQTNVPTNPAGGCTRVGVGNQVLDQYSSWKDGNHFFTAFSISWDGSKWIHSVQIGEYSPDPTGGFGFYEVGTNDGSGWKDASPYMVKGVDWDIQLEQTASGSESGTVARIQVDGIFKTADTTNCQEGFFKHAYMKPGDVIANAKALSTADEVVTLPVTVPLSVLCAPTGGEVCEDDLTTVGGFVFFADTTEGNSTAGLANSNITGIAYTGGAVGVSDTLGDGPTCPTPTFGGLLPTNPLFTPDTACQIDDDSVARGSFLSEWWDTNNGFIA